MRITIEPSNTHNQLEPSCQNIKVILKYPLDALNVYEAVSLM